MSKKITYSPPDPALIEQYAHVVCYEMGLIPAKRDTERGLAGFMKVIARVYANNLNRENEVVDSGINSD